MSIDTTGKSLVAHWGWASGKGLMKANTASALRAACSQVMSVLDDWQTVDVRTLDVDDTFKRFQNKRAKDFAPESLEQYKRRFARAVELFLAYADNPSAWKLTSREPSKRDKKSNGEGHHGAEVAGGEHVVERRPSAAPASGLVEYPFPLRAGRLAYIRLPADLTTAEVKRLTTFLESLAFDETSAEGVA
jgi:hypothetical protein